MINSELAASLISYESTLSRRRIALIVDGKQIDSCATLFAAMRNDPGLRSTSEWRSFSAYHECFILPALCAATWPVENSWRIAQLGEAIHASLDLGTIGSSFGPRRQAESYRFGDFDLPAPVFTNAGFTIETEAWQYGVEVLAITDFDGDGNADLLARFIDIAKAASYFDTSPVILRQASPGDPIQGERLIWSVLDGTFANWPDDPLTCAL
jgi:hypothetical protein